MKNINIYFVLFLSFIIRAAYSVYIHPPSSFIVSDMNIYFQASTMIKNGIWNDNHFFQPVGFPLILFMLRSFFSNWSLALSLAQALASTLTLFFIWKTVKEIWGEKMAFYSLMVGMLHIPWILFTGISLPETFYTFTLSILLYTGFKIVRNENTFFSSITWSAFFIIGFWMKGLHVFLLPIFLFALWIKDKEKYLLKAIIPIIIVFILGISAHGFLTFKTIGKFQLSATAGGLNFLEGKCPSKRNSDNHMTFFSPLYYHLRMDTYKKWNHPFSDSKFFMQEGLKCIYQNPSVLIQSFESIPFLFINNPIWPLDSHKYSQLIRLYEQIFVMLILPGLFIFMVAFAKKFSFEELCVFCLPILSVFIAVYIFKSETRYRLPFDVFIIPVAIRGIELLAMKFEIKHHKRPELRLIKLS